MSDYSIYNGAYTGPEVDAAIARARAGGQIDQNITALRAAVGSPLKASTVAGMTDHSRVYVYTGTETGYTAGHWYYWSGTAWTDGGVYNAIAFDTDTTLSIPGEAADAAAVGTAIEGVEDIIAPAYDPTQTYAVGDYCIHSNNLYRCKTAITTAESWTAAHWTQVQVMPEQATAIGELKSALSSEDVFVNDTLSYINYGYDTPFYRPENPSASNFRKRPGIKRDGMVVVLNKSITSQYVLRVIVSGDVQVISTTSETADLTGGITLQADHTYRGMVKLISGTAYETELGDGIVPTFGIYKVGSSSNIGTYVKTDGLCIRDIPITETANYNIALYIAADGGYYTDAKFLVTLEDVTESKTANMEEQITELDKNVERLSENLDNFFYTEKIDFEVSDWRTGYYGKNTGTYANSNLYICTANGYTISKSNATRLTAKAPDGCYIAAFEYDANGGFVARHGEMKNGTNAIEIKYTEGHNYKLTVGRFASQDASAHLTSEFISQIIVSVDETKMPDTDTKQDRTGDFEFFTVTVDRPLAFGGEEIIDPDEAQEIECVLRLPTSYTRNGAPTRLVLACHGAHGYINSANNYWYVAEWKTFMDALLDAGYAVFDSNVLPLSYGVSPVNVAGYALGSPLYINVLKKAYDYIVENYNVTKQIFAHGTSMGGVGATAFSHAYPELVLAESSFAGRDFIRYLPAVADGTVEDRFALAYGYETAADLIADKFSHAEGEFPSLSLVKYVNGAAQIPPDRETDFSGWLAYYTAIANLERNDDAGIWMGKRTVPYKAWNSWADSEGATKLEEILSKAYNTGNSCPYYTVTYETGTHSQMSYGQINDMIPQLIAWYKRWE